MNYVDWRVMPKPGHRPWCGHKVAETKGKLPEYIPVFSSDRRKVHIDSLYGLLERLMKPYSLSYQIVNSPSALDLGP